MLDWVIRGGTVIDGSGGAPFRADIGIRSGKIAAVGSCGEAAQPPSFAPASAVRSCGRG